MYNAMNHDPAMKHIKDLKSLITKDLYEYLNSYNMSLDKDKDIIVRYIDAFVDVVRLEEKLKDLPNI